MNFGTIRWFAITLLIVLVGVTVCAQPLSLDDSPARPGEWGFRPRDSEESPVNPPSFVWRPQQNAVSYDLECARDEAFKNVGYRAEGVIYNCHCPPKVLEPGRWYWRFRFEDKRSRKSKWRAQ